MWYGHVGGGLRPELLPPALSPRSPSRLARWVCAGGRGHASWRRGRQSEEDDLCPICFAAPQTAVLKPCNHQSCLRCIRRHVQSDVHCFFCKADVTGIQNVATGEVEPVVRPHTSARVPSHY